MKAGQFAKAAATALRNVIYGGNLASLRLLPHPRRMVQYASENLFSLKSQADARGLPQRNVFEVLQVPDEAGVVLGNLHGDTWFSLGSSYVTDIVSLCLVCRSLEPRVVFEIGTALGYSALHLALNSPDATIYTLDVPKEPGLRPALRTTILDDHHVHVSTGSFQYAFTGQPVAERISCLFGDSATFDYSPFAGRVDLFFIDGAHSYEYVRSDTLKAMSCCHAGSVIAWHDFGRVGVNGVSRWLQQFAAQGHDVYSVPGGSLAFMVVR